MATYKELMSGNNSYYLASRPQKAVAPKSDIVAEPKVKKYSGIERVGHTLGDFFGNIGVGIVKAGEGMVDYFAGLFGADKEKVAYDWTYEHLGKGLAEATKGSYMNGSKAGEIARSVASGVGGMLPAATANLLNLVAPGVGTALSATMFVTGAGGQGVEEAYQNGASYGKAMLYGSTVGALEGGIEALSGGIGGIGKNIGKSVGKSVAKGAGKSTAKSAIKSGVGQFAKNMVGEGVEEVASDLLNPIAKSIYTGNVDYGGVNAKSLLDTFTVGALSGGVMQGSQALVKNANTNLYVADKLSQVESINKSLDESYNVGNITDAQYAQGKADINKLLGKTSDRFAKASPSKQLKLEDYFDRKLGGAERYGLEFVKPSDNKEIVDGLEVNLPEPSKLIVTNKDNDYDKNSYSPSLLGQEERLIFKPTKVKLDDTKLAEIHTASKLLSANNSKIVVTDEIFDTDGVEGNGAYLDGDVLYVSRNANVAEQALKHEFTHRLEGTVAMDKFSKYVLDTIKASPELQAKYGSYDDRYSTTSKLYVVDNAVTGQDTTSDASKLIRQELVAQYASEELFTSQKQVNRLVRASRGFAGKVVNYIQSSLDKLGAKGLTPSERKAQDFLRHAESLYIKAIAKTGQLTKPTANGGSTSTLATEIKLDKHAKSAHNGIVLSKEEYAVLRTAVMTKNSNGQGMQPIDYAYTANWFYVYDNSGLDNFNVTKKFNIEEDSAQIKLIMEEFDNGKEGTYGNRETVLKRANEFRFGKGANRGDNVDVERGRTNGSDGRVYRAKHLRDAKSTATGGSGDKRGVKFSLKIGNEQLDVDGEMRDNLVALHNITEDKLLKTLSLGGFPMPSIAITKDNIPHDNFGAITVVFGKDTIDPENDLYNKVYSGDAWTPIVPKKEYLLDTQKVDDKFASLGELVEDIQSSMKFDVRQFLGEYRESNGDYVLTENQKDNLATRAYGNKGLLAAYLKEHGEKVEVKYNERTYTALKSNISSSLLDAFVQKVGEKRIVKAEEYADMTAIAREYLEEIKEMLRNADKANERVEQRDDKDASRLLERMRNYRLQEIENYSPTDCWRLIEMIRTNYLRNKGTQAYDAYATTGILQGQVSKDDFSKWITDFFNSAIAKEGLSNNADNFDRNGNRKSFAQSHSPYTLQGIVNAMRSQKQVGGGFVTSDGEIAARLSKSFDSINSIKEAKERLKLESSEEYGRQRKLGEELLDEISFDMAKSFEFQDDAREVVGECADKGLRTKSEIFKYLAKEYKSVWTFDISTAEKIELLFSVLSKYPTTYFEAKPRRAVGFDEIKQVLLPQSASKEIIESLEKRGIPYTFYNGKDGERSNIIQSLAGVKFSKKVTDNTENADQAQAVNRKAKRLTVGDTTRELKEIVANIEVGEDGSNDGIRIKNKDILAAAQYITATLNSKTKSADGQVAVEVAKRLVANAYLDLYTPELNECINTVKVLSKYKHKLRLDTFKADITHAFDKRTSAIMRLWGGGNVAVDDIAQDLREEGVYIEAVNQVDVFLEIMDKYERAKEIVDARAELVSDKLTAREQYKLSQAIIRPLMLSFDTMRGERGMSGRETQDAIAALKMQYKSRITDMKNRTRLTNSIFWQLDVVRDMVKRPSGKNPIAQEFINMANVLTTLKTTRGNFSTNARAVLDKYADIFARVRLDSNAYIEEIDAESVSMLKAFAASNGMLTTAELAGVETTLERFIFLARDGDKVFYEGKRVYAKEFAELAVEELESTAAKTKKTVLHAANKILDEMSDPRSIFERYGGYAKDGRLVGIYKELEKGVLAQMKFEQNVSNHFEAIVKELKKEKVDFRAVNIAVGENGKFISLGDAMSLILTAERSQAGKHLSNVDEERFVVEVVNDKYTAKGKYKLAVENKYDVVMSNADIARVKSGLTDHQREFLQSARVFFNEIARNAKESTDLENFGISNVVTDDSYFPEVVSKDDIYQDLYGDRANKAITVKSFGFNQSANVNANSKLVIENIFDVIARHTKQMAMYSGLTAPLKLINRVYNMKLEDGTSMKTCLNKIDAGAEKYIRELLEDVQGISSRNAEDNAISKFAMALYRGGVNAALGLNPKILMTQTLSLVASLNADIKIRNIVKGMALITSKSATKDGKALLAKLYEYSPLAWDRIKNGQSMEVADAMSKGGKIAKFTTAGIGWADKKVIETLWISSLYQVSNGKSLDSLSENEFKAAAELINETIIKTQANSHPLFNSKLKRSKSVFVKFSTMFMSDTFKQVNVFRENVNKSVYIAKEIKALERKLVNLRALSADAVDAKIVESRAEQAQELEARIAKLGAERKRAKVSASKAGTVIVVQTILLTLLAQVVKFATGKEEDDVIMDMATDFVGNVFGLFPIIRDIGSMIEGFEVSNFYESGLQNLFDATKGLTDNISMVASGQVIDQDILFKNFRTSLLGVAQTFGIPLRNIEKYSVGVLGWADKSSQYGYYDTFKNKGSSEYRKDIEKALKSGDERLADTIINRMVKDKSVEVTDKHYRDYILKNRDADVAPRNINAEFSYQGKKYIVDKKQDVAFRAKYEPSVNQVAQMMDYKVFKDMSIEMQSKSIQFIYDYYYDIARADIVKSRATQKYDKLIFLRDVKEVALLFMQIDELRPDVNVEGKPIAGSRKNKILKLLAHYGYSREEKKLALDILGYNTDNM